MSHTDKIQAAAVGAPIAFLVFTVSLFTVSSKILITAVQGVGFSLV